MKYETDKFTVDVMGDLISIGRKDNGDVVHSLSMPWDAWLAKAGFVPDWVKKATNVGEREPGFYWVKYNKEWMVAKYYPSTKRWDIIGHEICFDTEDIDEIGERVER